MAEKRPLLAITIGDPAGIGPEIAVKALRNEELHRLARCLVVGSSRFLGETESELRLVPDPAAGMYRPGILNCLEIPVPAEVITIGKVSAVAGRAAYDAIAKATALALSGAVQAIVTGPIHKEALRAAGIPHAGHTEILGALTGSPRPLTMFEVEKLRVFFLSRHVSLRESCDLVTRDALMATAREALAALGRLGIGGPLAIAGLNPHCGDGGLFGSQEETEIKPAVAALRRQGYDVCGPIPADAVFSQARQGKYGAVLSLYHDQGHIAAKTLDFERTVSVTHGLPFLRTSVDHGTAFDIAGKQMASSVNMEEAIKKAAQYAPVIR